MRLHATTGCRARPAGLDGRPQVLHAGVQLPLYVLGRPQRLDRLDDPSAANGVTGMLEGHPQARHAGAVLAVTMVGQCSDLWPGACTTDGYVRIHIAIAGGE